MRSPDIQPLRAIDPAATRSSLVQRLHQWDDQDGWQDFFNTYWKFICGVAIKAGLSNVEAQDLVQETVVMIAAEAPSKNWLCMITRRRIIDHFRKRTNPNL